MVNHAPASVVERRIRGAEIGLPLVETLGAIRSHAASRITWHRHRRFELLLLLEGSTAYEFRDGRTVDLPGGHFLIVPPGHAHRGVHDVRQPAHLCGIVFDPHQPRAWSHTPFTSADLQTLARRFLAEALVARPMGPDLLRLAQQLSRRVQAAAGQGSEPFAAAQLRSTVCSALLETARQLAPAPRPGARAVAEAVTSHLQKHLAEPLSIPALVHKTGYGRARLFQLFKQATGTTPNDAHQRLRIQRARELLQQGRRSITEIASSTGFTTSQYFSNVFRKYTGLSPTEFRRQPHP